MEKEIPLYMTIYHKVVNRILVGFYRKGQRLSSAQKVHDQYGVGYTSIRRAMRLLQEDGFIRLEERKSPEVIFDPEDPKCQALRWQIFLRRCGAHLDCYRAMPYLVPGMAALGAARRSDALLEELDGFSGAGPAELSTRSGLLMHVHAYVRRLIGGAGSGLADDLIYQLLGFDELRCIVLESGPLMPGEAENALSWLAHLTDLVRRDEVEEVHALLSHCYRQMACELERVFRDVDRSALTGRSLEFSWYVRQSPTPLYRKIAYDLLRRAQADNLSPGDSFPPEAALVERYGVAGVTIRSALALLGELGFARTINGVGTQFAADYRYSAKADEHVREYFESLELLAACARALALSAAPRLGRADVDALRAGAADYRERNGLLVWLFNRLLTFVPPNPALGNIIDQLEGRLIFGLYLNDPAHGPLQQRYHEATYLSVLECLARLERREARAFAERFSGLFDETLRASRARLARLREQENG